MLMPPRLAPTSVLPRVGRRSRQLIDAPDPRSRGVDQQAEERNDRGGELEVAGDHAAEFAHIASNCPQLRRGPLHEDDFHRVTLLQQDVNWTDAERRQFLEEIEIRKPFPNSTCIHCHSTQNPGWSKIGDQVLAALGITAPLAITSASCAASAANLLGADTNGRPVRSAITVAQRSANSGCVLMPVPTAVPPIASS